MRQVKLYIAASLDGKIARSDHSLDWLPESGEDDFGYGALMDAVDTILLGYSTYDVCIGLGDWPYKGKTSYIFTRDATKECNEHAELITEDPVAFTCKLKKQEGKDIWLIGGGEIIRQLHDAGLIDEYIIATIPVILGKGIELFPNINKEQKLTLTKHKVYSDGLALMYYTPNAT